MEADARFERCLAEVLHHEGGYADHPKDPGGATKLGVTLGVARAFGLDKDGDGDVDKTDVRSLTPADARMVYGRGYWTPCRCGDLPAGIDLMVFDLAVNSGVRRASALLQEAVGAPVDSRVGPVTLQRAREADPLAILSRMLVLRRRFYRSLSSYGVFGRGWERRLAAVYARAAQWAVGR